MQNKPKKIRYLPTRSLRVLVLLVILTPLVYAYQAEPSPAPDWSEPLVIGVYPVSSAVTTALETLDASRYAPIEQFLNAKAHTYRLPADSAVVVRTGRPIDSAPELPPGQRNDFHQFLWALKLRWWHWRFDEQGLDPDVIVIARYGPATDDPRLLHSIGMPSPRLALVNLTAHPELAERNNVVITHEILHTIGANDRYRPGTGHPEFPHGYADPEQSPLYPQTGAEIMGGRIPLSATLARQPRNLGETTIGPITAAEIGWIRRGE